MHTSDSDHGDGGVGGVGLCRNELRHWRELMTGKAGLRELCSSSGAAFHHQSVSPGKRCDFLCASVMTSCTWLSLHSPVLPGTLSAAFLNQVPLTLFLFKQYTLDGTPEPLHEASCICLMHRGDFVLTHPSPRGSWTCCSTTTCWLAHGYESPSCLSYIDLLLPTAYKSEISRQVFWVFLCVFTHPAAPSIPLTLPKRLPGLYLICTHQSNLGPGWQAHFPHSAWSSTAVMSRTNQAPRVVL